MSELSPQFTIGTLVDHPAFGRGRIVAYEGSRYVAVFPGGDARKVEFSYDGMREVEPAGDPESEKLKQAVREVLGDYGWIDTELEMHPRWIGGTMRLIPGKDDTQSKDVPIEAFFKKIIGVREKLRVLEQKINNNKNLSTEEKIELESYITRSYGSLTTFNVLFADKASQFRGQSEKD